MTTIPKFDQTVLGEICKVLADTTTGLSGSEIGQCLEQLGLGIDDPGSSMTKWRRLNAALSQRQQRDQCGNLVVAFIKMAMAPVRYRNIPGDFDSKRHELNKVLAFCGYSLGDDGELHSQEPVQTIDEAEERAGRLRSELRRRGIHPDVLAFCQPEFLQLNYFHAVFEATKSVADKIREKTGLSSDGSGLVDQVFGIGKEEMPLLAFNSLRTDSEKSEHTGLMNLMKGMFGTFRNVTAHEPKIKWVISEQDALDLLTIASFLHRRLDNAVRTPRAA